MNYLDSWINVFNPVDLLSFPVEFLWPQAKDISLKSTGMNRDSHGAYFTEEEFYEKIANHLIGTLEERRQN